MKRAILASVSALALVTMIGSANAADLSRRDSMPVKAPLYSAAYNWTGLYAGINGGGGWGNSDSDLSGVVLGGTLGYNYQMGQVVFGLEGDFDWSHIRGDQNNAGFSTETRNDWLATVRGRIGYSFDRIMPFVTGGAAFGNVKNSVAGFGDNDDTKAGWTLGGGIEAAIAGPWTAKVEYLYVDLGNNDTNFGTDTNFRTNIVRAGLNYRF